MGARPRDIVRMVSGQGIRVVAAGLALGIPATLALGSLIDSLLFGVRSNDPVTLTAVSLVLAAVALAAAILPARKAAHGDPLVALRADG
jgi:ABC-type antimicrobial peptide transport system permease subunit